MADIKYIIPFTYKWEGGLSRATTDSASKNPANISPYTIDGKTGWHTNKGITYSVFKEGAKKYGYQDTLENWKTMPHDIWLKITRNGYWDKLKLDNVKSQAVANVLFSWIWGSGYAWVPRVSKYLKSNGIDWTGGSYVKDANGKSVLKLASDFNQISDKLNQLVDKVGEKKAFDDLAEQKKQFLLSLKGTTSNPVTDKYPQGVYTDGWMNRLADLQKYSYTLFGDVADVVKKNLGKTIVLTLTVSLLITGIVMYSIKN